jgi:hypothetical protein
MDEPLGDEQTDWRLDIGGGGLEGARLIKKAYPSVWRKPNWDHDHCDFCAAKFMAIECQDVLHQGYCTEDEERWICDQCFEDFKRRFKWTVVNA